jgi:acyl transferase domain-containing protein/acyl carrier protein
MTRSSARWPKSSTAPDIDTMSNEQESPELSAQKRALFAIRDLKARLEAIERARTEPIAIVGMACRLPGAPTVEQYWALLRDGVDAIRPVPPDRWDVEGLYDPDPEAPGKTYCREGGFVEHLDLFDAPFFGVPPREVQSMDPQQRMLLEVSWEALEDAGIAPAGLNGTNAGVFIGLGTNDYTEYTMHNPDSSRIDAYVGTGSASCVAAGRISFVLGLHGPAMTVDTACSSSLVAVDLAVQQLRSGKCRMALAGGVNAILSARSTVYLSKIRALSPTGRCRSFDAAADGYARGEGCGVLVLKRLSDAERDGDRVLALIRGSATNHDGRSSGLTVPNGAAQESVVRLALADAGLEPSHVHYIEAHGTGTPLGDPIEIRALGAVFGKERPHRLIVGTAKTNIGHLEAASGVAGIIKIVLAMQHGVIPRTLHFTTPSPHIPWDDLFVTIAKEPTAWPDASAAPVAGISGYGFSGTNAHVILQAAAAPVPAQAAVGGVVIADRPQHLLTLSAQTTPGVIDLASALERVCVESTFSAADIAYSSNTGRSQFEERVAVLGQTTEQFAQGLRAVAGEREHPLVIRGRAAAEPARIGFLFTGQGSQYTGMGRELYDTDATFRRALDECDEILKPVLDQRLLSVLYATTERERALIDQTAYTQPALFAVEYALAQVWRSWGVEPSFVMGHSLGEYVAACVAGLIGLEDGLRLIAARARLMQSMPEGGRMAAVFAPEAVVLSAIDAFRDTLSVAAINGPEHFVISGKGADVTAVQERLTAKGIRSQPLVVSHAFHSPLMEPMLDAFEQEVAKVTWRTPRVRLVSNLTGDVASASELSQPSYWRRHLRAPVRFSPSLETLVANDCKWLLEVGPHPTLLGMAARCLPEGAVLSLPSLRKGTNDTQQMLKTLGTMFVHGADVDWRGFDRDRGRQRVSLPHYPFQRRRHWADASPSVPRVAAAMDSAEEHPLLGERLRSPLLTDHVFQLRLPSPPLAFLADHVVYGAVVFPATAYVEMATAGARVLLETDDVALEDFAVEEPLAMTAGTSYAVQVAFTPLEQGRSSFQIFSREASSSDAEAAWTRHATGRVHLRDAKTSAQPDALAEIRRRCDRAVDTSQFYERLKSVGIQYGPTFQGVSELWRGVDEAVGLLRLPSQLAEASGQFAIHPAFMDAALQVLGATVSDGDNSSGEVFLPVGISHITYHAPPPSTVWSHIRLFRDARADTLSAAIQWYDEQGHLVWEANGVTLKRATPQALQRASERKTDEWLYEVDWQAAQPPAASGAAPAGTWLIFADHGTTGSRVADEIRSRGGTPVLVRAGEAFARTADGYSIDPQSRDQLDRVIRDVTANTLAGVVHLWSLDSRNEAFDVERLDHAMNRVCGSMLLLVQVLARTKAASPRLVLVTRAGVAVGSAPRPPQLAQAPVWGLARVIALEQPQWQCLTIDLDPGDDAREPAAIVDEIVAPADETQVAFRGGARLVARLVRKRRSQSSDRRLNLPTGDFRLTTKSRGVLDNLFFEPQPRAVPGPGEVEIRVHASGLNFRDVLNALGMYPGDPGPMGGECAGRVSALGLGVTDLQVGDEVVCVAGGSFSRHVITPRQAVVQLPSSLTYEQGAAIPMTFLTAYYGLHHLAGIKKGSRVLVHAAAGGVGQAAVQIALRAGAEVYGTAGSIEKREFVRELGVRHVFSSRTADFTSELMALTGGHGVDIVLNSLTAGFISESLKVLAPGGHFLEMGKAEIWTPEAVAAVNPNVTYRPFDLGDVIQNERETLASMFTEVMKGLEQGELQVLPTRVFDIRDAMAAFRFMAQAKHVGKIVLSQREVIAEESETGFGLDADATYLVTGGTGGLGLKVAEWLVGRKARHLVLVGRSAPSDESRRAMDAMVSTGATVTVARGDVANESDMRRIITAIDATPHPLRGVIHAAGVLDDGMLTDLDWSRFQKVLAPKVRGAWLLHELTRRHRLDFLVLFSSTSAVLGSPGQGNYAAANAFLDALAQYRQTHGAVALSVNWGAWSEVGMAARLQGRDQSRIADRGVGVISPELGLRTLGRLLNQPAANVVVLPVRWQAFLEAIPGAPPPMLRVMAKTAVRRKETTRTDAAGSALKAQLLSVSAPERTDILVAFLRQQVGKALGLENGDGVDLQATFTDLGLDSLMAVEVRNGVASALGQSLPASLVFDHPTIAQLADHIVTTLLPAADGPATSSASPASPDSAAPGAAELLATIDEMSNERIDTLLNAMLADQGLRNG